MTTHRQAALIAAAITTARFDYETLDRRLDEIELIAESFTDWLKAKSDEDKR